MKDLFTGATLAVNNMAKNEEQEAAKASWKKMAEAYWSAQAGIAEKETRSMKPERANALRWLAATEHMIVAACGWGWQKFQQPDDVAKRHPQPERWPVVTLSIDQGSDGWCAVQFMLSLGINIALVNDVSHRTWNDCELGLRDADLWFTCTIFSTVLSIDAGPWSGSRWWEEAQEGAQEQSWQ